MISSKRIIYFIEKFLDSELSLDFVAKELNIRWMMVGEFKTIPLLGGYLLFSLQDRGGERLGALK